MSKVVGIPVGTTLNPNKIKGTGGVGIKTVEQTTMSTDDNGKNIITITLTNGNQYTVELVNGSKGAPGNGIESAILNDDYTLTLEFTEGGSYTTPSLRGPTGMTGEAGADGKDGATLEEVLVGLSDKTEEWTFALANGEIVTKKVVLL